MERASGRHGPDAGEAMRRVRRDVNLSGGGYSRAAAVSLRGAAAASSLVVDPMIFPSWP